MIQAWQKLESDVLNPRDLFIRPVQYVVPEFQRPYVWTKEHQWEPLWDDIINKTQDIIEKSESVHHFMGAIALQQQPSPTNSIVARSIVDGQQRLITLQLFIDAIRAAAGERGYEENAKRLSSLVKNSSEWWAGNPDAQCKVWPSIYDRDAFRNVIADEPFTDETRTQSIYAAWDYFKSMTDEWLDKFGDEPAERDAAVEALEQMVSQRIELAVIDLRFDDDAYIIYETLNARGTDLLPSDMIKNRILHVANISPTNDDEQISPEEANVWSFSDTWWREPIGRGNQRRPRIDSYLNHWLTLRNRDETKSRDEFASFSKYLSEGAGKGKPIREIAADINQIGKTYESIEKSEINGLEEFLRRRQIMGIGGVVPVLLWLLSSNVPATQLNESITALESYIVRRMICGLGARNYGKFFAVLVDELEQSGADAASTTVLNYLSAPESAGNEWPDNPSLLETFLHRPVYKLTPANRINLILRGIEGELRSTMSEVQDVPTSLHIEHIMPQGWTQNWPLPTRRNLEKNTEERNRIIHTMGNLTLVSDKLNSTLSNAVWEDKRATLDIYAVLRLNRTLLDDAGDNWNEAEIRKRGQKLYQEAIKVWPHASEIKV